jgi:hypothetical protein
MSVAPKRPITLALLLTALAAPAYAQDVQYSSITKVDLGGGMNAVLKLAGASEVRETTSIKGKKLRSDSDKQSTIFDLDNSRYIVLDHSAKTYTSVPLADMAQVATSAVRGVRADKSSDKLKGSAVDSAGNKADFVVDLKVDPTGERRNVNGYDAQRLLVTMETNVRVTPQGETQSQEAGTLVILMDTWNANTGPAADAVRAWEQAASKELAAAAFGTKSNLGAAFPGNPNVSEAMKKASEEAQKADGIAVKTTMHLVFVAAGQKFDRALALKETEGGGAGEKAKGGLKGNVGSRTRGEDSATAPATAAGTGRQDSGHVREGGDGRSRRAQRLAPSVDVRGPGWVPGGQARSGSGEVGVSGCPARREECCVTFQQEGTAGYRRWIARGRSFPSRRCPV